MKSRLPGADQDRSRSRLQRDTVTPTCHCRGGEVLHEQGKVGEEEEPLTVVLALDGIGGAEKRGMEEGEWGRGGGSFLGRCWSREFGGKKGGELG